MEQKTFLKIPRDRIGVLVGPRGRVKKQIENVFGVSLIIDSSSGSVDIVLDSESKDVSVIFTVRNIVKAIGRGFSPVRARMLADENFDLHIINLKEYVGDSKNALARIKGRVIGKNGRSRLLLEELTETQISVYGDTISMIGSAENLRVAREAVIMLIKGSFHKTVWNFLYAYRRKMKKEMGEIWYEKARPRRI